jgi:hypothetical protein
MAAVTTPREIENFLWPSGVHETTKWFISALLWELAERGPAFDTSGRASSILWNRLDERGFTPPSKVRFSQILQELSGPKWNYAIIREQNGRRTYRIELEAAVLPKNPLSPPPRARRLTSLPDPEPAQTEPAAEEPAAQIEVVKEELRDPIDIAIEMMSLANALISAMVAIREADEGTENQTLEDLYSAREENLRLRRRLREAEDLATKRAHEIEGLRMSVLQMDANIQALLRGDAHVNDDAVRRAMKFVAEPSKGAL